MGVEETVRLSLHVAAQVGSERVAGWVLGSGGDVDVMDEWMWRRLGVWGARMEM